MGHFLRCHEGDLISKHALYQPAHGKPRHGGRKILFYEYAAELISADPPSSHEISFLAQDRNTWKRMEVDCLLAPLGTTMNVSAEQRESSN